MANTSIVPSAQERLFFPVDDVHFEGLYNWADDSQRCKVNHGTVRRMSRQDSQAATAIDINEVQLALFRFGERVYAINKKCPHAGGPLHLGDIEVLPDRSLCVRCPWHSWRFNLENGKVCHPKGRDVTAVVYPTKVREDGTILVGFEEFSPSYFNGNGDF